MQDRKAQLTSVAVEHGWSVSQDDVMQILDGSCLYRLTFSFSRSYQNFIKGDDWQYNEVTFKTYGTSGINIYRTRTVTYCMMGVPLPRKLPNIIFDSLEHQKRQFRVVFDPRQYIQLEGNFNTYFATYFGLDYAIDDLSFITPEVMQSLIAGSAYDVEIIHDKLLIFGQVSNDAEKQLLEMSKLLEDVRSKLLHNITTYRDERVPYDKGRQIVARAGMFLSGPRTASSIHATFVAVIILSLIALCVAAVIIVN